MGELKSAWEIARRKAEKLGKLSAEELRQQREENCRQIGEAIARKYLDGPDRLNLDGELEKQPEEDRGLIKRAILAQLIEAMDLRFFTSFRMTGGPLRMTDKTVGMTDEPFRMTGGAEKVIEGIARLEPESGAVIEQLRQLLQEYEAATRQTRHDIESKSREALHRLRISGTAVGDINVEAMPQWQEEWHRLRAPFEPRLEGLKQELVELSRR